ncbi:BTAD domain-containing putative transcriptional regulator [Saccharopolyspora sp. NPDC050389]|uniref:BTAD domain-containing putative transcriptional regulator n=1 Tax=Saccharopolyspora sp. NPDC050389 TaxID=3155516 RepID=UPI0033DB9E8E
MRIGVLGPLEISSGGENVVVGGVRLRTLLSRLALDSGRTVSVEALTEALWPGADGPADRVHALHSLVSRLRRLLPDAVLRESNGYRLNAESVDCRQFEELARDGRRALHDGHVELAGRLLCEALALWRGVAFEDVPDAPFAVAARAWLAELRLAAIEDRAQVDLQTGCESPQLVTELQALTAAHPDRERARALLLRALQSTGRTAEALSSYEEFRAALAERLGADPSLELREAHLAVLREETTTRPRGSKLRAELTSFVGRDAELALVNRRLAEHRLVTLTGPGGVGKTRLATTAAAGLAGEQAVWFAELASVSDPADVPQAVLGTLGPRGAPHGRDALDRLADALSPAPAVLVLDNCEHQLDAVASLADGLLGSCPGLRLLATSREPLGLLGEALVPVPPLGLAPSGSDVAGVLASPAVRLFVDRARAANPDFAVTAGNAGVVAEICRRLDGLPLAIELASARIRSLPADRVLALLDDRFRLLTEGNRAALPRHRTLRAVVDWSWGLLDEAERSVAESLAVFGGSMTVEAAERVCTGGRPAAVLLSALADKSLLVVESVHDGQSIRYRMPDTIREYGLERLADADRVRAAHARYFREIAEQAAPHLRGPEQLRWAPRLAANRDNFRAALHFACGAGDADTAIRLATALAYYLTLHGDHAEAARLLRMALELPAGSTTANRVPATAAYLLNAVLSGEVATDVIDRCRETAGSEHPSGAVIEPLIALLSGDFDAASAAIDRRQPHPAPLARAMLSFVRSLVDGNRGALRQTCDDLAAAAEQFRALGERWGMVTSLTYLGIVRTMLGDPDAAIAALRRSMAPARELGNDHHQRVWLATAHAHAGDAERAAAELRGVVESEPAAQHLALARLKLGDLARGGGDLRAAEEEYDLARWAAGPRRDVDPVFRSLHGVAQARLALARGACEAARRDLRSALTAASATSDMVLVAAVGSAIAELPARSGEFAAAAELLGAAGALRGAPDALNPDIARLTGDVRAALGESAASEAAARGNRLCRPEILRLFEHHLAEPEVLGDISAGQNP